ncbi:MAG: tetratricopeptide repeat protein [Pseudomonadota bacterium]
MPSASAPQKTPREKAIDSYNQGIRYRDKAWSIAEDLNGATDKARTRLERKIAKQHKTSAARFQRAISEVPEFPEAHAGLGYALRQAGDLNGSLAAYDEAIRLKPNYPEAIEYRAETYLAMGRIDDMRDAYSRLLTLDKATADKLLDAIKSFIENPPENYSPATLKTLATWAEERATLAQVVNPNRDQGNRW